MVAKAVEDDFHLNALLNFSAELFQENATDAVLLELEVIEQNVLLCPFNDVEEVAELYLCRWQDSHLVAFIQSKSQLQEVTFGALGRVFALAKHETWQQEGKYEESFNHFLCKGTKRLGIRD